MTSRLKKRPAHHHRHAAMTTASEHVVARVGKSPSDFYDYDYYSYDQNMFNVGLRLSLTTAVYV